MDEDVQISTIASPADISRLHGTIRKLTKRNNEHRPIDRPPQYYTSRRFHL